MDSVVEYVDENVDEDWRVNVRVTAPVNVDEYHVLVFRYKNHNSQYLNPHGEWVDYVGGEIIQPCLRIPGTTVHKGRIQWRGSGVLDMAGIIANEATHMLQGVVETMMKGGDGR